MGVAEQFSWRIGKSRGREWVVVDSSNALTLRPLSDKPTLKRCS